MVTPKLEQGHLCQFMGFLINEEFIRQKAAYILMGRMGKTEKTIFPHRHYKI